jgi:hypothetical protein
MSENIFKQLVVEVVTREPHPQGVWAVARVVEPNGDTYLFEATCGPNILKISGPNNLMDYLHDRYTEEAFSLTVRDAVLDPQPRKPNFMPNLED